MRLIQAILLNFKIFFSVFVFIFVIGFFMQKKVFKDLYGYRGLIHSGKLVELALKANTFIDVVDKHLVQAKTLGELIRSNYQNRYEGRMKVTVLKESRYLLPVVSLAPNLTTAQANLEKMVEDLKKVYAGRVETNKKLLELEQKKYADQNKNLMELLSARNGKLNLNLLEIFSSNKIVTSKIDESLKAGRIQNISLVEKGAVSQTVVAPNRKILLILVFILSFFISSLIVVLIEEVRVYNKN